MIIIQAQIYFSIGTKVTIKNKPELGVFTVENHYINVSPNEKITVKYNLNSMPIYKSVSGFYVNIPMKGILQEDLALYEDSADDNNNSEFSLTV